MLLLLLLLLLLAAAGAAPPAPPLMLELFRRWQDRHPPAHVVRAIRPVAYESIRRNELWGQATRHTLTFKLARANYEEELHGAELHLHAPQDMACMFEVSTWGGRRLDSRHILHSTDQWISLNVTEAVVPAGAGGTLKLLVSPLDLKNEEPLLLLFYNSEKETLHRRRRAIDAEQFEEQTNQIWNGQIKTHRSTCRRRPLYVDFSEINYDKWIVAPAGYEAYQCAGRCQWPVSEQLSPTKHAIVQMLLHSVAPRRAPRVCCVPTRLDPISVLYLDERGVLTYRYSYHDMVVTECGCR